MKVLVFCRTVPTDIQTKRGIPGGKPESWISGYIDSFSNATDQELIVAFPCPPRSSEVNEIISGIRYVGFSLISDVNRYCQKDVECICSIINEQKADVIHIFGTETPYTYTIVNAAISAHKVDRVVISIQGLVSVIGKYHCFANLPNRVVHAFTLRDIIKQDNIYKSRQCYLNRGRFEVKAIQTVKHVIGRTDWDKACTQQLNPEINYHFCNETLRKSFYENRWCIDGCERHSIFVSQSSYPLKGFHHTLDAMPIILRQYPDAHLYTTGNNPLNAKTIMQKARQTSYQRYLSSLIKRSGLEEKVTFLGRLDEQQMCDAFLRSHVVVSPSSIENSPNSVGEAMILGMPVVSSDVGGVKNLMEHNKEGFVYQSDAPYMLAYYVMRYFEDDTLAQQHGNEARDHALETHDPKRNLDTLMEIYRGIAVI